jgi:hypothetical protein
VAGSVVLGPGHDVRRMIGARVHPDQFDSLST